MTASPGESVALTIDKPAAGGRMIARLDGQIVLVGGAIPGERSSMRRRIDGRWRAIRCAADASTRTFRIHGSSTSRRR
jgi:tRNA/tmRNA/rRNA uracil-C5-methylase (TrmA/RlmC/RlmD family)